MPTIRATLLVALIQARNVNGLPAKIGSLNGNFVNPNNVLAPLLAIDVPGTAPANFARVSSRLEPATAAPTSARSSSPSCALAYCLAFWRVDFSSPFCGNVHSLAFVLAAAKPTSISGTATDTAAMAGSGQFSNLPAR